MEPEKTSIWKKEISLGRKKPKPEASAEPAKTPFWKKEISLSRTNEPALDPGAFAAVPTAEQDAEVDVDVFGWDPEAAAETPQPEPVPAPAVEAPAPVAEAPSAPAEPKRKRLGRPKLERKPKERKPKQPKQPKEAKAPKQPKEPKQAKQPRQKRAKGSQRHKKLVGLKVGASQLAAARVANNGSAQLLQVVREPLEAGIVVGGELRDPDALAEALKAFFRKHKLPRRGVRLGIANNRIGVRSFDLEGIEDTKQLDNAVRFRAQEALPIPIEEAVLDYQVLGERLDDDGKTVRRVLLVVAYRDLVDRYVDACRKAGIRLAGIDLEAFALLRALGERRGEDEGEPDSATVAVAVGHDRSTFAVSNGRACEFTRVLEWGGFSVNVAVGRALDLAPSEAEPIKRALSLIDDEVPEGLTPEQAETAREAIRRQIAAFARELVSSLQYYQSQPDSLSIAGITLTGGTAHLPGLAGELQRLIGVPVEVGDPLTRVRLGKKATPGEQVGSFAVAIGLGIED